MEGPRHPTRDEIPSLSELLDRTFRTREYESGARDWLLRQYPQLINHDNLSNLWVFSDGGQIVAHVGVFPRQMCIEGSLVGTAAIGAVATYERYRGQGLASQLMSAAIKQAQDLGRSLMPISGGRGLYTRLGAVDCQRTVKYGINRASAAMLADPSITLRQATVEDLPTVAALYRSEPLRYVRLPVDYQRAFNIQFVMNSPASFWMFYRRGASQPCAYAIVQKQFHRDEQALCIFESAGDKHATLGGLEALFKSQALQALGCQTLVWLALAHECGLRARLEGAGIVGQPESTGGTVLVLDPVRLLKDLDAYQAGRLGAERRLEVSVEQDQATFRVKDASWSCAASDVSRVLLGSVCNDPPRPLPPSGAVAEVIAALTPIPIAHYGVSYV